jgi:two-component system, NarL family, response regulator NreC
MSIRVLIADDHPLVREGLRHALDRGRPGLEIIAEVANGLELMKAAATHPVDIFIIDITMPLMNGLDAARALLKRDPAARIIMLTMHDSRALVEEAMGIGARGYLTKETASSKVVDAVREVNAGRYYLSPDVMQFMVDKARTGPDEGARARRVDLTTQERRILQLISEGRSGKEIAAELGRSINTVNAHRKNLMAKLGLHKQTDLVRYALKEGIGKL